MATETIIWTALPNGILQRDGETLAQLSIFVSPRLKATADEGDTLSLYRNVRHWADTLNALTSFTLEFDGGSVEAKPISTWETQWWEGLFKDDTYVRPYEFKDYTDRLIISYPVIRILKFLKQTYQSVGFESPNDLPILLTRRGQRVLKDNANYYGFEWNKQLAQETRRRMASQLFRTSRQFTGTISDEEFGHLVQMQGETSDPKQDLQQLMLFHYPPERLNRTDEEDEAAVTKPLTPLPKTEADFERYMDFHEVISSLGDYPVLMRRLGLVIDVTVPVAEIPPHTQSVRAVPQWASPDIVLTSSSPRTAVQISVPRNIFRTRQNPTIFPRIQQGQLQLDPNTDGVELVEVDVDGAALKLIGLMNTIGSSSRSPANDTSDKGGLPTLRSAGLSLNLSERAAHTFAHFNRTLNNNNAPDLDKVMFYAEDVLRGYIVDIWDSVTKRWHSLCSRRGSYRVEGTDLLLENVYDEGFAQMAMTQQSKPAEDEPPPSTDLYLHESMFRWDGWSLVAPRPGKTIGEQGDTNSVTVEPKPTPQMPFKLITEFSARPRSLPKLRYGVGYRMRVRVADICGNALALDDGDEEFAIPAPPNNPLRYLRYEPVGAPSVFLRNSITVQDAGESLARLVIRSFNTSVDQDIVPVTATSERHVSPPPTSEIMLELHGMLDDEQGRLKTDLATYNKIKDREQAVTNDDTLSPVFPDPQMAITYLPEPLSLGAAMRNLPGTTDGTLGILDATAALAWKPVEGIEVRPGSATLLPFEQIHKDDPLDNLLARQPFRIVLTEHADGTFSEPEWDNDARTLTMFLPKSEEQTFALSSYVHAEDLKLLGVWQWIREYIDERIQANLGNPVELEALSKQVVNCVQYALEGGHWMVTPARLITIVHAVQQPIGIPHIIILLATRSASETNSHFTGLMQVHGKSTLTFNLVAHWSEPLDDPNDVRSEFQWTTLTFDRQVDDFSLKSLANDVIPGKQVDKANPNAKLPVGTYDPKNDTVLFAPVNGKIASPVHEFGDTKHRMVTYHFVTGTRFREYFDNNVVGGFTRDSNSVTISVPSSARPAAPAVRYVIPTYGWKRDVTTNLIGSYRQGGGLRVYLERPWFSSGEGELLGVVLWKGSLPDDRTRHALARYITQWGQDPIWGAAPTPDLPAESYFTNRVTPNDTSAVLPELSKLSEKNIATGDNSVFIAGFPVEYDESRGLWFSDIEVNLENTYYPFIKLALVRYQPNSVAAHHISTVTMAEFAQLAPDRSAILTFDPYDPDTFNMVVSGFTYKSTADIAGNVRPDGSQFKISVEQRDPDLMDDLAWRPVTNAIITAEQANSIEKVLWKGRISLPSKRRNGEYRIVIEEYEGLIRRLDVMRARQLSIGVHDVNAVAAVTLSARSLRLQRNQHFTRYARLVYADTIEV